MSEVLVAGRKIRTDPSRAIGKGGEADVFDAGGGIALKVYKGPKHPDYAGDEAARRAAVVRIAERGLKLPRFPKRVPERIVAPIDLALDPKTKDVAGYTMRLVPGAEPLLRFAEPSFRKGGAVPVERVLAILRDLHRTVGETHAAGIVIGDFNDLNVLVAGERAFLIDADSFQYGGFLCDVFTERFVDPLLCDPSAAAPALVKPFGEDSDWFAFDALAAQSLLLTGVWGGVHKSVKPGRRALARIPVWHSEVVYPRPAIPWSVLPDDLMQRFHQTFEKDRRGEFPRALLESMRWTRCASCGLEHARPLCPKCVHTAPARVLETITRRGEVVARRVLVTRGTVVHVAIEGTTPRWIVHESGAFRREDGTEILRAPLHPAMRFAIRGDDTLIARGGELTVMTRRTSFRVGIDSPDSFACAGRRIFRAHDGRLLRETTSDVFSPERVGEVLAGQTRIWADEEFGFGLYRAGSVQVAFVFDAERNGIREDVKIPRLTGALIHARCVFGAGRAWLLLAMQEGARIVHQCVSIRRDGRIEAAASAVRGDGTWLGGALEGACAAGPCLFVPTDDGIVRIEAAGGSISKTREFPDTEPFVHSGCRLHAGNDGLWVQSDTELVHLEMK